MQIRQGNSGPFFEVPTLVPRAKQIDWQPTVLGQTTNLLEVLPADHAPGMYLLSVYSMVRVPGGGSLTLSEAWTYSDGGAQSVASGTSTGTGASSAAVVGMARQGATAGNILRVIYSDGVSPITCRLAAAQGTVGTPTIDVSAVAVMIALP